MYLLELCLPHASICDALCPVLAPTYLVMVVIRRSNRPSGRLHGGLQVVGVLGGILDKTLYINSLYQVKIMTVKLYVCSRDGVIEKSNLINY